MAVENVTECIPRVLPQRHARLQKHVLLRAGTLLMAEEPVLGGLASVVSKASARAGRLTHFGAL